MSARIIGITIIILGVFLLVTPRYIFPVCGVGRYAPEPGTPIGKHGCHDTLKAETALGIALLPLGLVPVMWPRRKVLMGVSIATLLTALLVILFPTVITGICKMPTMPCRLGTQPALVIEGILLGLAGVAGLLAARKLP